MGRESLTLNLPASKIRFLGLSQSQKNTLIKSYPGFLSEENLPVDIECQTYRLKNTPKFSNDELTINGQYAPRKVRHADDNGLNITGVNFEASFALISPGPSSLGVVEEKELAYANVIENYLRIVSAHKVLGHRGLVLHSAGLVFDDEAYIFSGRSNAGKTTLTRKSYEIGARVLSDDINLVLPGGAGYNAYAVPFTGEFGRTLEHDGGKESYPLAGIILLEQGDRLEASAVSESIAVARLLSGCPFVNTDKDESEALFDSVTRLVSKVPVIRLLNRRADKIDDIMNEVKRQFTQLYSLHSTDTRIAL